ncbi:MAG: lamin tail domain-containing protein, partial [Planctomycetota bacterium]|nr:lamin tail domain-containing protein [Planctomycetota bacterium]
MSLSFRPCPPCRFFPPFRPCRPDVVVVLALLGSLYPGSTSHGDGVGIVVITEIMYHPRGGGQDREYVELYNATPAPIDLSGWFFSRGISFTFPAGTWLDGNTYLLVAADAERIREAYGIENVVGDWASCDAGGRGSGCALDNGGETLELAEHNGVVHARVRYNDRGRWPAGADGTGHSLEMVSPYREQDDPGSWLISGDRGGSPGGPNNAADRAAKRPPVRINEALLLTNGERWLELFNLSETVELDVSGLFLTDERQNLAKSRIPDGTTIAPGGWLTFTESQLGLDFTPVAEDAASPPRLFLALATADATQVIDAYSFRP